MTVNSSVVGAMTLIDGDRSQILIADSGILRALNLVDCSNEGMGIRNFNKNTQAIEDRIH